MNSYCQADCENCNSKKTCKGCVVTGGKPFGEACLAAEYIKLGGTEAYRAFKQTLLNEINALLQSADVPPAEALYELKGEFVNLSYPLPNGESVRFLDDNKIYLGSQIEFADRGICYGVVADTGFILICRYSVNGSLPELVMFKRR